ncbi:MAG: hypothetical protein JOZ57_00915, partial [Abitibacteriaceae bacterium]|nr:hypothetical protein [Abditibacteriaceae bacterium]
MFVTQGGMNRLLLMGLFCLMLVSQTLAQGSLTVTNTGDSGAGSLRDAITTANSTPGTVITFNIPNTDSGCNAATGVCTITPASPLPGITAANTTIDGYTQSGASANTLSVGDNANLKIQITGTNAGDTGLLLRGGNDVVRGLIINGFQPASNGTSGGAIDLMSNNNAVTGCWLGTDTTGTAVANNYRGVWINTNPGQNIYHSDNNVVGGTTPAARNIISGNANTGVQIIFGPTGNLVQGNYIGTDKNGAAALSNGEGVVIDVANNNTIGGAAAGTGNVISGNTNGVRVDTGGGNESSGRNNTIAGNLIGLNAAGAAAIPNGTGITFGYYGSGNTVGGAGDGAGNVISGNTGDGINLNGTNAGSNTIQGNIIGLNQAGTAKIGNGGNGITFGNTTGSSVIGGTTAPMRNVISGNGGNGITDNTGGNIIQGNYIGTNISGSVALGNTNAGILITQGGDTIGGTATGAGNVLSGNGFDGIIINGAKTGGSTIQGNLIGLNAVGTAALGNHGLGVNIINGSSQNTIGGTTALARNVISGNGSNGVGIGGNNGTTSGANTANNTVQGNYIGTNAAGTAALPNALAGVDIISGASGNLIGGVSDGQSNLIAFNTGDGVHVQDATTLNNSIRGNSIHDNGKLGINLVGGTENAAGVTANGTNPRSGPNKLQNYPVITNVSVASDNTTITGTLTSTPNATFTLDFYRNTVTDPTGFGEGQVYIGSQNATTAQNGQTTFTFTATGTGQSFTATATDNAGNTSEFSRAAQAATSSSFGSNLIVNPGAEAGPGSTSGNDIEPVPGWTTSGNFTVIPYGPNNGGITTTDPGPPSRGKNYFAGGPNNAASSATQTINVSSGATAIDAGGVTFNLSGFLGGFAEQEDNAVLAITFKSAAGAALGNAHIGPVTAAERKSATGLVQRTITGTVPRGTRSILVTLTLTRTAGSYNDGYADNLTLTLTQPTSSACAVPPAGLVAWYRAEGNANDSSGNGHNGTLQGSATFTTGKVGQAFSFNGVNSFVQVPSSPALDPIQAATYDAWVYFNQLPSAAGHTMQIVAKSGSGRDLDLQAETDNKFHFYVAGGTTVVSKIVIQSSHWYYIAATYRATDRIAIYVNGVLDNTTLIPGVTRQANGNPLTIGENFTFRGRYFNGRIDEVSLYNLAMSAAEIRANYVAGSSG